jgi:hypothetical protein
MKGVNSQENKNFTRIMSFRTKENHPRHKESRPTENVLVLQGGGSLGAFACGVFKALVKKENENRYSCRYIYWSHKRSHNGWE